MPKGARSSSRKAPASSPTPQDRKRYPFPVTLRLRRKVEFEAVQSGGRRTRNAYFAMTARENDVGVPRLGLAVSIKSAGNAVERNRIRRTIRESFRLRQHELAPFDLVVSARPSVRGANRSLLRTELESLWQGFKRP